MKKLLSIFSLGVLLFSSLAPSFTYAVDINEVSSLLESFLHSTDNEQQENSENIFQQSSNTDLQTLGEEETGNDEIEIIGDNNHIIWNKTKGLITIYTGNYSYGITLKDKDLGAQNVGENGLYYQWGNNHGKTEGQELLDTLIERGDYDGKGYDGNITGFINRLNENNDYWEIEDSNNPLESLHNNLWGGGNDDQNNNFGYDETTHKATNVSERRGPCPEGYHVPSLGERSKLVQTYFNGINKPEYLTEDDTYNGIYYTNSSEGANRFINTFKINLGGQIHIQNGENLNNTLVSSKYYSYLWTSTPKPLNDQYNNLVFNVGISNDFVYTNRSYNRSVGLQVRCFKNEYIPYSKKVIFNPNGGAFSGMEINQTKEYTYTSDENGIIPIYNIQIPDRRSEDITQQSGWMFAGWYTKDGTNNDWGEEFDISNPNSTTAYAKWLPFNDLELDVIGLPGVMIMDRNMGAENIAIGIHKNDNNDQSEDNEKLGLYYQWGNNYGFKNIESSIKIGNDLISNTGNTIKPRGPNNYFYNNLFVGVTRFPYRWNLEENFNLWGGENNRNSDLDKKGPCPQGYHIPDIQEWNAIYNKLQTNQSTICEGNTSELWKCFAEKLKLPFAGKLNSNDGIIAGKGNYGNYWSANPYSIDNSYHISFGTYTNIQDQSTNASGKPIRCFKNNVYFNKLKLNIGNDEENKTFKLRRWETIGAYLLNIEKKGFELLGWYDDNLYINETDTKNTINSDKSIFAKREKNPRYTFNGNGGKFNDGKEEIEIKYLIKREEYNKSTNSSYGSFTIEGAKALNVTLNKTDDYGTYHEVCIYNHIKTDTTQGEDCIIRGKAGEINNVHINGDTVGFVIRQNGPPIAAEFNIVADNGYETDDNVGEPSNSGYTFSGWYETGATDPFDFTGTEVTKDRTFYAKWNPHHYTIQFDINEGTGTAEDINATYGEEITLPTISKEGYTFKGWKSEDGIIYNNIIPEGTGVTTEDGVTVTLTAQWELIPVITPSAGGGQAITPNKQETKVTEQEHNSADNEDQKVINTQTNILTSNTVATEEIKQKVIKVQERALTRGEVAIMTNILLDVYPQLTENRELNEVSEACENYADEQNFTKDEKKAITRLCKLSIMGIHADDNKPLEEFLVNSKSTNDEFSKVINRSLSTYTEKDFSVVKDALKKLEGDEENVVFGTVYEVFMSIKNIFN